MNEPDLADRHIVHCCYAFIILATLAGIAWAINAFFSVPPSAGERHRQAACSNDLRYLVVAIQKYVSVAGCFFPAYSTDKAGRPTQSWRVFGILPGVGCMDVYDECHLDEPWNSEHNLAVLGRVNSSVFFQCASIPYGSEEDHRNETNYVMVVGSETISDGPTRVRSEDITDGLENTIMIVEIKDLDIHWAEPRDLKFDEMSFRINDPDRPSISSHHPGGAHVAFCDGRVRFLKNDTDPKIVRALLTIAGGEDVSEFLKTLDEEEAARKY